MACIKIADSIIPANTNVPFDARTRVLTEADILNIENPAIGMTVYVEETGITYIIKSLKAGKAGILTIQNKLVDRYEKFIPTKVSELEQDIQVGGITEESDPIYLADKPNIALKSEIPSVPTWALASSKPTYTWSEIQEKPTIPSIEGLATEQYVDNLIDNKANSSDIPKNVSQLLNDKDFISREECIALIQEALAEFNPGTSEVPAATLTLNDGTLIVSDNNPLDQFSPHVEDGTLVLDDPNNSLDDVASVENGTVIA